jgi:hypothetical protein
VIRTLAELAHREGKTIIFTIHQPRSDIFALFDDLLIFSSGTALYSGTRLNAGKHFKSLGTPCPEDYNMADHLLDIATAKTVQAERSRRKSSFVGGSFTSLLTRRMTGFSGSASSSRPGSTVYANNQDPSEVTVVPRDFQLTAPALNHSNALTSARRISFALPSRRGSFAVKNSGSGGLLLGHVSEGRMATTDDGSSGGLNAEADSVGGTTVNEPNVVESENVFEDGFEVGFNTQMSVLMKRAGRILIRTPTLLMAHIAIAVVLGSTSLMMIVFFILY